MTIFESNYRHKLQDKMNADEILGNRKMDSKFREYSLFSTLIKEIKSVGG